jgi:hypothetical protein
VIERLLLVATLAACAASCGARDGLTTEVPQMLRPFGGEWTGSVWAERSLRPRFSWTAAPGASRYDLQVDDSCDAPATCAFPSPELDASVATTELQPPDPLPVALTPPVGRRYFWHVRACGDVDCGPWSPTRYVNVGRQRQDFNGDGYGDLLTTTRGFYVDGAVDVYFGGVLATLGERPRWTLASEGTKGVGGLSRWPGDLDGDGFPDLATVAYARDRQWLRIYLGGPTPATTPALEIEDPGCIDDLQRLSDLDGDGFDDLSLSRSTFPSTNPANVILFGGQPLSSTASRTIRLPASRPDGYERLFGVGDLDGDEGADLLRVRPGPAFAKLSWAGGDRPALAERPLRLAPPVAQMDVVAPLGDLLGTGTAYALFTTGATETSPGHFRVASLVERDGDGRCDSDLPPGSAPYAVATLGDLDGDGRDDFAIGAPEANRVSLFFGGCRLGRTFELAGPHPRPDSHGWFASPRLGHQLESPGDMDGDGFPELAVTLTVSGPDSFDGQVLVYRGGPTLAAAPSAILPTPTRAREGFGLTY